jgi:hypothetical protein
LSAAGGFRTISVTASSPMCTWTARSNVDWLTVVEGAQGTGNGQVRYEARGTSGSARSGTLVIAGNEIAISQASCAYTLSPGLYDVAQSGGNGTFAVNASAGCAWTATSAAPWVTLSSASSGTGPGAVTFSAGPNAMGLPARTGIITVNDQTFRVNQAAGVPCAYTLTGNIQWFPAAGAPWSFLVATGAACSWTAKPSASWITITSAPSGIGDGRVIFAVSPYAPGSPSRSGTITVGNSIFQVIQ